MAEPRPTNPAAGEAEAFLERYLSGDALAFEMLVGLYEDRLYGYLERFTGDSHLAEDVFQQVFMKVADKAESFDRRSSFSTWLFRIARNAAVDELRRRRRDRITVGFDADDGREPADDSPTPLESLAGLELRERILAAVAALPYSQREAFLLKEEAELGFQEIADIAGCPKETVKSRFRLAVEKLRAVLAADVPGPERGQHG